MTSNTQTHFPTAYKPSIRRFNLQEIINAVTNLVSKDINCFSLCILALFFFFCAELFVYFDQSRTARISWRVDDVNYSLAQKLRFRRSWKVGSMARAGHCNNIRHASNFPLARSISVARRSAATLFPILL